jgi:hypothetical protein
VRITYVSGSPGKGVAGTFINSGAIAKADMLILSGATRNL